MPFDLQGHRGARGLAPENTLAGFEVALGLGVTTLETDLAVTCDGVVVLHHDRRLNPDTTRGADGRWLAAPGPLIRNVTYAELQAYDVGRIDPDCAYALRFPRQVPVDGARIPRLGDLFALGRQSGRAPRYNIEIKTSPLAPDETVDVESFVRAVIVEIRSARMEAQTTVQAFDFAVLLAIRRLAPDIATSALTIDADDESTVRGPDGGASPWLAGLDAGNPAATVPDLAAAAGASIWSPCWHNLTPENVAHAHALGLSVVPWTVNEPDEVAAVVSLGVDGLITDYPGSHFFAGTSV